MRALQKMRRERAQRRDLIGTSTLSVNQAQLSGRKVITVDNISYRWNEQQLIENFSSVLWRGDKVGIVGLNGSGKTTLLNLLLGKLEPQQGSISTGTKLTVAYFDQHRAQLDESLSVAENVSPFGEMVTLNGRPRHIITYLQDFLFTPETCRSPITKLSGGERARLLLARLFLQPANVLVLDEPTNDLDIETVELLEERLLEYPGTLLLVSHDRSFLNNVVTSTIALEGDGRVVEYNGGCEDWLTQYTARQAAQQLAAKTPAPQAPTPAAAEPVDAPPRKLSNKERAALKHLPIQIEQLEATHAALSEKMSQAAYYQDPHSDPAADAAKLEQLEADTLAAYEQLDALGGV